MKYNSFNYVRLNADGEPDSPTILPNPVLQLLLRIQIIHKAVREMNL